jgi:hypothetical protein
METFVGLLVVLLVFAAVVGCMVYMADFEKHTGLPRRRAFYLLIAFILVVVVVLFLLYEFGILESGLG